VPVTSINRLGRLAVTSWPRARHQDISPLAAPPLATPARLDQHVQHIEMVHALRSAGIHIEIYVAHHHRGIPVHAHLEVLESDIFGER
jgi:hypothetical protein